MTAETGRYRILVADDNADAAESLAMLLRLAGHEVVVAQDGVNAVARAGEFRPALALVDISMPQLDGYGVAQAIRREHWGRDIFLVALTGWAQPANRSRALEAGFDQHVAKPIGIDGLRELLSCLPRRGSDEEPGR